VNKVKWPTWEIPPIDVVLCECGKEIATTTTNMYFVFKFFKVIHGTLQTVQK